MSLVEAPIKNVAELAALLPLMPGWAKPHALRTIANMRGSVGETPVEMSANQYWAQLVRNGLLLSEYPWFKALNSMHRLISTMVMTIGNRSPEVMNTAIATQRSTIRIGKMRRSDDVEVLTALVLLTAKQQLSGSDVAKRMHNIYEHLKLDHWWPVGPEDLPLCALIAALPGTVESHLAAIKLTYSTLSEKDEVPGDPLDLVVLAWSGGVQHLDETIEQIKALRTGFILSGFAFGDGDALALSRLLVMHRNPEEVVTKYCSLRQQYRHCLGREFSDLAAECAADAIILDGDHVIAAIHRAGMILRFWMSQRNQTLTVPWP
jgi:Protein of unknown function (DUF4003)